MPVDQVADVVEEGRGDERVAGALGLRQHRRLQRMGELRYRLAAVHGSTLGRVERDQLVDDRHRPGPTPAP
jgi:hypothetical protein